MNNLISIIIPIFNEEKVIEKKRGLGMFVKVGACERLLKLEKKRFLQEESPRILERINRLGFNIEELL